MKNDFTVEFLFQHKHLEERVEEVHHTLQAQQLALQLLANMCCAADDDEGGKFCWHVLLFFWYWLIESLLVKVLDCKGNYAEDHVIEIMDMNRGRVA